MNRRRFLTLTMAGASGAVSSAAFGGRIALAAADQPLSQPNHAAQLDRGGSVSRAYGFLTSAMDTYQQGATTRLIQSYSDQLGQGSTAFVYDNSVAIIAYLQRGKRDDVARAMLLGDSFLYAQAHDETYADGRVRQAYWVGPFTLPHASNDFYFVRPDGSVNLVGAPWFFVGSSVSDMCWVGIALAHLFARTRKRPYLEGSLQLAQWIVDNAFDIVGLGGYSAGVDGNNQRLSSKKLTEHNIDVYAFFSNLLAPLTGDRTWGELGQHAFEFIVRMWNPDGPFFYIGSSDGKTIDTTPVLEEVQSESYLALLDRHFADVLDWDKTNLVATDTPQSPHAGFTGNLRLTGVTFSDLSRRATERANPSDPLPDPDAVWFEGTARMAMALAARNRGPHRDLPTFNGDVATASGYLQQVILAQTELGRGQTFNGVAVPDASGVVAASSTLNTGIGFSYFPSLHIGATSWYSIAAQSGNPYQR